jgi:hypothetical protein
MSLLMVDSGELVTVLDAPDTTALGLIWARGEDGVITTVREVDGRSPKLGDLVMLPGSEGAQGRLGRVAHELGDGCTVAFLDNGEEGTYRFGTGPGQLRLVVEVDAPYLSVVAAGGFITMVRSLVSDPLVAGNHVLVKDGVAVAKSPVTHPGAVARASSPYRLEGRSFWLVKLQNGEEGEILVRECGALDVREGNVVLLDFTNSVILKNFGSNLR